MGSARIDGQFPKAEEIRINVQERQTAYGIPEGNAGNPSDQ